MSFVEEGKALLPELQSLRRQLHQIPELNLDLPNTQKVVLDQLKGLPIEVTTGTRCTSVTGVLRGASDGPVVLLRGDMDGLPITEETGLPFASTNGNMHACGHDLHISGLIGAAKILSAHKAELPGTVVFMFQPGEEAVHGAQVMIDEGILDAAGKKPDAAYGIHVWGSEPFGVFGTRGGPLMAGANTLKVTVLGKGGHGSAPHTTLDPVPVVAEIVLGIQAYVARHINVFDPIVVTVARIQGGVPVNAIPTSATLEASVRTLSKENLAKLDEDFPRLASGIASAYGCTAETIFTHSVPVTANDPSEAQFALSTVSAMLGADRAFEMPTPMMGSEDFSYVLEQVPGAFIILGAQPPSIPVGEASSNHSSKVLFDDGVLGDQAAVLAQLAFDRLAQLSA